MRILKFSTSRSLSPQEGLKAIEAAREAARAAENVPGVKSCTLYLGTGALVFAAQSAGYASADKALTDSGVQATFGRLGHEFGYVVSGDEFTLDPEQVYPFIQR